MRNQMRGSKQVTIRLGVGCDVPGDVSDGLYRNIAGGGTRQALPVRRVRSVVSFTHVDAGAIPAGAAAATGPMTPVVMSINGSSITYALLYAQTDGTFDQVPDNQDITAEAFDVTLEIDD